MLRTYFSSVLIGRFREVVLGIHSAVLDSFAILPSLVGLCVDVVLGSLHTVLHPVLSVVEGSASLGLGILRLEGGRECGREGRRRGKSLE